MWFYESHLGGLYWSNKQLDSYTLYCETCNDVDKEIGEFDTPQEFLDSAYWLDYDVEYICDLINSAFFDYTPESAVEEAKNKHMESEE